MRCGRTLVAVFAAAALLGICGSAASAARLSMSSQTWRASFSALEFSGIFGAIRCPVTLESSLHASTLAKTAGSLIGYVNRVAIGPCAAGSMVVLSLPWHLRYASFSGTLPTITALDATIVGMAISIREAGIGITCLFRTTAEQPVTLSVRREAGGALAEPVLGGEIRTGASCGELAGTLRGSGNVTVSGGSTRVTLTLI